MKRTKSKAPSVNGATITGCTVTAAAGNSLPPEAIRAVEALANAVSKNAEALIAAAQALKGTEPGSIKYGIALGVPDDA